MEQLYIFSHSTVIHPSIKFVTWLTISTNHNIDLNKWCRVIDTPFTHNIPKYEAYILTQYECTAHLLEDGSDCAKMAHNSLHHGFTLLNCGKKGCLLHRSTKLVIHVGNYVHLHSLCPILEWVTKVELRKQSMGHMLHPACSMTIVIQVNINQVRLLFNDDT